MSILDSQIAPVLVVLSLFAILFGFFRHLFVKVLGFLLLEIALFVAFPKMQVWLAQLVSLIRSQLK